MPRRELNSPTERIGRLLEDFDALSSYAEQIFLILSEDASGETLKRLPPIPHHYAIAEEKKYREQNLSRIAKARSHMRRQRFVAGHLSSIEEEKEKEVTTTIADISSFPNVDPCEIGDVAGTSEEMKKKLEHLLKEGENP